MNRGGLRHLPEAFARGAFAFVVVAAVGQLLAFGARIVAGTGPSVATTAKIGAIYVGAFNHVAIEFRVLGSAATAGGRSTSLSVGVALLSVTALAVWMLFRGARSIAERVGGTVAVRMLNGAVLAPAYAVPVFALALLVDVRTSLRIGAFAPGDLLVSLSRWQALLVPLAIAAVAGAAGGLASALRSDHATTRMRAVRASVAGGWRMFVLSVALSLGGLFVAGVVQADETVAYLTPSTARYWRSVFDRPDVGLAAFAHHVAALPNEAMWTLVPAMGACDVIRGDTNADLLCYGRFPDALEEAADPASDGDVPLPTDDAVSFDRLPAGYLLFLVVPMVATLLGGRHAAAVSERTGRSVLSVGAASGLVFAAFVTTVALLSTVVIAYGAPNGAGTTGWVLVGPDVVTGSVLGVVWGCVGGAVGAATSLRSWARTRADGRTNAGRVR